MSKRSERKRVRANRVCFPGQGIHCHCGWKSERREHREITPDLLAKPFYYKQWYQCTNPDCNTTTFMEEKDRVMNPIGATRAMRKNQERIEIVSFFHSL